VSQEIFARDICFVVVVANSTFPFGSEMLALSLSDGQFSFHENDSKSAYECNCSDSRNYIYSEL